MDSTSSTAALNNFLDDLDDANPPFLSCKNCVCQDYTPDPAAEEVSVRIKLCDLHKSNLQAPNPAPARPFNSPAQPITVPGANRALPPGRRIGDDDDQQNAPNAVVVDIPTPPPGLPASSSTPLRSRSPRPYRTSPSRPSPARSRSPLRRPIPSNSPSTDRGRRTTSNLPADALATYKRVLRKCHDPANRRKKIADILETENISRRTWHRKRPIAELQMLDPTQFNTLLEKALSGADPNKRRLNQEAFSNDCSKILARPVMIAKKRRAVAAGKLI